MSCKGTHLELMCSRQAFRSEANSAKVDVCHTHTAVPCLLHVKPESGSNWDKTLLLYTLHPLQTVKDNSEPQESLLET